MHARPSRSSCDGELTDLCLLYTRVRGVLWRWSLLRMDTDVVRRCWHPAADQQRCCRPNAVHMLREWRLLFPALLGECWYCMIARFDCNVVINEDYYYYYYYHVSSVQAWSRSGVTEHSTTFCAGQRPPLTQPSLNSVLGGWTVSMNPVREFPRVFFVHLIHAET